MKLTMRIGAAMSIAALTACSQSGQDDAAGTDANAEMMANETGQDNLSNATDNSTNSY